MAIISSAAAALAGDDRRSDSDILALWRPHYHFAPARNWLSDPNGLVFLQGEYHLFYQYNPFGSAWGHMSWGHAVSLDLVAWTELPVALAEDAQHMIFSGSAVVDHDNSSGLGDGTSPPLVACYTGAEPHPGGHQVQCLAFSQDRGRTWTKFAGNPVLDVGRADFRDPKIFWHAASRAWVMVAVMADESRALLFRSANLIEWVPAGAIGPFHLPGKIWECPDLLELPVEGRAETRWFFKVDILHPDDPARSGAIGVSGTFDGSEFQPDMKADGAAWQWIDHGQDFYAAVGWNNVEKPIWIGWMGNHRYQGQLPECGWRGAMSLPRTLSLRQADNTYVLVQKPIAPPLRPIRTGHLNLAKGGVSVLASALPRAFQARFEAVSGYLHLAVQAGQAVLSIIIDAERGQISCDRATAGTLVDLEYGPSMATPPAVLDASLPVEIWFDDHCVEIFANDGALVFTAQHFLALGSVSLSATAGERGSRFSAHVARIDKKA